MTDQKTDVALVDPAQGSLLEMALEKGVDVEKLERLIALQERAADRNARSGFLEALRSFQEECPPPPKSKTAKIATAGGGSYSYSYATLDGIATTIRAVLHRHGLSYTWTTEASDDLSVLNVVCILRHVDGHEERATFPVPVETSAKMSAAQKTGSALTYGRRQSLVSVLGLTTAEDDVDGATGASDSESIDSAQIKDLNKLLSTSGADTKRFLAYMGVGALAEITQDDFKKAIASLNRKAEASK